MDEDVFTALMTEQKERARAARSAGSGWESDGAVVAGLAKTEFAGYGATSSEGTVLAVLPSENEGEAAVVLDRTAFYAESGGQVGDTGTLASDGASAEVYDTKKKDGVFIHYCRMTSGEFAVGDTVRAEVNAARRAATERNHSAAHLLHARLDVCSHATLSRGVLC